MRRLTPRQAAIIAAVLAGVIAALGVGDAEASVRVGNPHHAHVIKRKVTRDGRFVVRTYSGKVYVGHAWKRTVFVRRRVRVAAHWRTKHSRCLRFNQRVKHGKGRGHRIVCSPIITREQRLRMRIVKLAQHALSVHTGFYRYSQGGATTSDPTPRWGRTDCSQFTRAIYLRATGRDIGGNTWMQSARGRQTFHPKPGDLMLSRNTGHVELYVGRGRTIGHGSPPIDYGRTSYWPGHYFVTFFRR